MLVLTRKRGESIMIGDDIEIVIVGTEGDTVRVGIKAPKSVGVFRSEVYLSIRESNQEATARKISLDELSEMMRKTEK